MFADNVWVYIISTDLYYTRFLTMSDSQDSTEIEIDESDPRAREILMNLLDSGHRRIGLLAYERMSESEREEAKSRIREVALASRDVFVANQLWVLHQVYNDREFIEPWADPASPHLDHLSEDDRNYVVEVVQYMLDHPPPGPDAPG